MKKSFTQFPSLTELAMVLKTETQRPIPAGKRSLHWASVEPFIKFLSFLSVPVGDISLDRSWQEVRLTAGRIQKEIVAKITSGNPEKIAPAAKELYAYLSEEDVPQKSDLIITFGAKTPQRAIKAAELFEKNLAPKILFSGGSPWYARGGNEAENYKTIAMSAGVPAKDILLEPDSITLADNIRSSLNLLDRLSFSYKNIIVVNSPYCQRRGYSHLMKYTPVKTKVFRVNCETKKGLQQDDWFRNQEGIEYVIQECYKLWFGLVINSN